MAFSGKYPYTLDAKGRVAVPARFREQIAREPVADLRLSLSADLEHLKLYPATAWEQLLARIESIANPSQRKAAKDFVFGNTHEVVFDGQGRILVPQELRSAAGLGSEVTIVGYGDHVQMWAPERYADRQAAVREAMAASPAIVEVLTS